MITRLRARLDAGSDDGSDDGISLVELLVTMGLMSLVSAMTLYFFLGVSKAADTTDASNNATAQARAVLDGWTSLLRVADSPTMPGQTGDRFVQITPTSAIFYANSGTNRDGPSAAPGQARTATHKISLSLVNGTLVQSIDNGTPQTLATGVISTGTATSWLFTPYAGTPPVSASANDCPNNAIGLCASTAAGATLLANVTRVDLQFSLQPTGSTSIRTFSSSASLSGTGN